MTRFCRLRVFASLASLLLLVAMTAYVSHHHDDANQVPTAEHCDLCLQLGAAAGGSVIPAALPGADVPMYWLPLDAGGIQPASLFRHCLQARAPPGFLHS